MSFYGYCGNPAAQHCVATTFVTAQGRSDVAKILAAAPAAPRPAAPDAASFAINAPDVD